MEKIRDLLSELMTTISAKRMSLNMKDGIERCSVPQKITDDSNVALDSAMFAVSEQRIVCPYVIIIGQHEKIVLIGAGPKNFLSVELICEEMVSNETIQRIQETAEKISKIIK